jgi:signal transduction histidine kinase
LPDGRPKQILGCVTDISSYKHAEQELRELSARLLSVQDEERRRIARELHDVTAQNIAVINYNLSILEKIAGLSSETKEMLAECRMLCRESHEEIRTLSYVLHPPLLDELGLVRALDWFIEGFVKRSEIEVHFDVKKEIGRLSTEMETDLFRVVQEALINIRRHSGSRKASVVLDLQDDQLTLHIEDQGTGLPDKVDEEKSSFEISPGVGIPGMRERLRHHKGSLEIRSSSTGTALIAVVPVVQVKKGYE